jgi:hypothetical protein
MKESRKMKVKSMRKKITEKEGKETGSSED